ncbi:MAG: arylsulfatase [Planctomycetaceae bacterium]|nr:MAG: arylsulfatase [Planctomycetaceae bacterium]
MGAVSEIHDDHSGATPMNRSLILYLLFILCAGPALAVESERRHSPNILLIMVDDMGYSDIGCYGGEVRTPTLDALAADGVRLARFYNAAQCCPSRASLLSGLYPHQAGVGDMNEQGARSDLWRRIGSPAYLGFKTEGIVTLPEALRAAGYQTFMSGKWHLGQEQIRWPGQRGFDRHFALIGGACEQFTGYRSWQKKGPISRFVLNGEIVKELLPDFYTTDTFTDYTLRFIEESDPDLPWFGYLAFTAPHWPLQAHESDVAKYLDTYRVGPHVIRQRRFERLKELGLVPDDARLPDLDPTVTEEAKHAKSERNELWMRHFAGMIDRVDQNLARIVEVLRQRKQLDNTLILFLSDNGADTVHGTLWGQVSNTPFRKFKVWVHDGGIASPLVAHWPAGIPATQRGKIVTGPAHIMDIFPTCLEAAGAEHPPAFAGHPVPKLEGQSILPALQGEAVSLPMDRPLFWERMGNEAMRQGHWKLVRGYAAAAESGDIATSGSRTGEWELYDTSIDPGETQNLAASQAERLAAMQSQFEAWASRVGVVPREDIVKQMKPTP